MKRVYLCLLLLLITAYSAMAQKPGQSVEVTDEDVGDSASFNKNAKFFGVALTGLVIVYVSCDPLDLGFELGPDDRCIAVTDPSVTTDVRFNDIGRISFPAKKADNIIYMLSSHFLFHSFTNTSATAARGLFSYTPSITIESVALQDPAAINPATGLPMNGSYTTGLSSASTIEKQLAPGYFESQTNNYSRAATGGLSRRFWADLGLPQSVINEIYEKPMTIRFNIRVRVRRVDYAQAVLGIRFLAN